MASLSQVVRNHQILSRDVKQTSINFRSSGLNEEIIDQLRAKLEGIKSINETLVKRKKVLESRSPLFAHIKTVTLISIGFMALSATVSALISIINIGINRDGKNSATNAFLLVISLIGLCSNGVIAPALMAIDDDRDKWRLLCRISQIEELGETFIDAFLEALKGFCQKPDSDQLKTCIQHYDKIPCNNSIKTEMPTREHWVSMLIETLPKDHTLREQIWELYKNALIRSAASSSLNSTVSYTQSDVTSSNQSPFSSAEQARKQEIELLDLEKGKNVNPQNYSFLWNEFLNELGVNVDHVYTHGKKLNMQGIAD